MAKAKNIKRKHAKPEVAERNWVVKNDFNVASTHADKRLKKDRHKKDYRFEC